MTRRRSARSSCLHQRSSSSCLSSAAREGALQRVCLVVLARSKSGRRTYSRTQGIQHTRGINSLYYSCLHRSLSSCLIRSTDGSAINRGRVLLRQRKQGLILELYLVGSWRSPCQITQFVSIVCRSYLALGGCRTEASSAFRRL